MEPTNELITKAEANAEGFSVVPNLVSVFYITQ